MMTAVAVLLHTPFEAVTVYVVVLDGDAFTVAADDVFKPLVGNHE
jgi:hypothetical protein